MFLEGHHLGDSGIFAEGHQWGDSGIFAEGHQWGDSGIFAEGHQWGDSGMFAEAWNNRDLFSEVADSVVTPSDTAIQDEDGEEPVQEWETTERSTPIAPPLN